MASERGLERLQLLLERLDALLLLEEPRLGQPHRGSPFLGLPSRLRALVLALGALRCKASLEIGEEPLACGSVRLDRGKPPLQCRDLSRLLGEAGFRSEVCGRRILGLSQCLDARFLERRQQATQLGDDHLALDEQLSALTRLLAEPGELLAQGCHLGADRAQVAIGLGELLFRDRRVGAAGLGGG